MHVSSSCDLISVTPGRVSTFHVTVTNTGSVIDAYQLRVFGLDPTWVAAEPSRISLFPGESETVAIHLDLPMDMPSAHRALAVDVHAENDPGEFALTQVNLDVEPRVRMRVQTDPSMVTGGRSARFGLIVTNDGNTAVEADVVATDPEELAVFSFEPPRVIVPPGRSQVVHITASGGRSWFGQLRPRTFELGVQAGTRHEAMATFIQRPKIGRWLLSLLGLLLAAGVFAAVLSRTFNQVVEEASLDDRILEQALSSDSAGGAVVPVNPAGISGSVLSASTQTGVSGVQVELFVADDTTVPVASAATDADGVFTFARLGVGAFKIRFVGAGFDSTWFGPSPTPGGAAEVTTVLGKVAELPPFALGARPGSVAGVVVGDDPVGAVVSLTVSGQLDPDQAALVATTEVSADGTFEFEEVPSPAVYRLAVAKPGFATENRDVVLRPAQALSGIEVLLRSGDGIVSGTVSAATGPLGGATVTATDGSATITTVTLTQGAVGTYTLRNLPTPGRYSVTISRDGYISESRSLVLETSQSLSGFDATMVQALGSVSGSASIDGTGAAGGITVTLTGTDVERVTTSVSQGVIGSYRFDQVPAPGTYTVTFSRDGLVSQVRLVDLDARAGQVEVGGIDATLTRDRAVVRGIVRGTDALPLGRATLLLSDGTTERRFLSADEPAGAFEFADVPPGAYTLTASRQGTTAVVVLVNVLANQVQDLELDLGIQASLAGRALLELDDNLGPQPYVGAVVALFEPGTFPGSPLTALANAVVDEDGNYEFLGLDAPADWIVAVFASADSSDPLTSLAVATEPGGQVTVADLLVFG